MLNGANLLSLLEKHGHKARINIKEAKEVLQDGLSVEASYVIYIRGAIICQQSIGIT